MVPHLSEADTLTVAEVAVVADVSARYVNQVVEEHVLPSEIYFADGKRRFLPSAAALVAFNHRTSRILTRDARHDAFAELIRRHHGELVEEAHWRSWQTLLDDESVEIDLVRINMVAVFREVAGRLDELAEARALVVSDPEILSGTPVLAGTRVPVRDIAASAEARIAPSRIAAAYGIGEREIGLACLWAKANPPMGRPRRMMPPPSPGAAAKRIPRRRRPG